MVLNICILWYGRSPLQADELRMTRIENPYPCQDQENGRSPQCQALPCVIYLLYENVPHGGVCVLCSPGTMLHTGSTFLR